MELSNKSKREFGSLATGCLLAAALVSTPAYSNSFEQALTSGKANVDMRLRFESVDDSTNKDAEAGTLRTRLGYTTGDYNGFTAFAEFEDVRIAAGMDEYAPLITGYATVADPEVTQLNQALIAYQGLSDTTIKLGKQRMILDNARHIGNVGWRQNEQTFDALSLVNTSAPDTTITYAFMDKVDGILTKFDANVTNHLLNLAYSGFTPAKMTAYAYLLEDDDSDAENETYGLRISGASTLSEGNKLLYTAEFANQSTNNNDADYTFIEAGVTFSGVTAKVGHEVLGSDDGLYGFQTPLATKHAFNGWADQFLATPGDGLQDTLLLIGGKLAGIKLLAVYHEYSADDGDAEYGDELNLLAAKKFGKHYTLGIKHASYSADEADASRNDSDKLWVWGQLQI